MYNNEEEDRLISEMITTTETLNFSQFCYFQLLVNCQLLKD